MTDIATLCGRPMLPPRSAASMRARMALSAGASPKPTASLPMNMTLERLSRAVMSVSVHVLHTRAILSYVRSTLLWLQEAQQPEPHTLQWWRRKKKENLRRQQEQEGQRASGIQTGGMMSSSGGSRPDLA